MRISGLCCLGLLLTLSMPSFSQPDVFSQAAYVKQKEMQAELDAARWEAQRQQEAMRRELIEQRAAIEASLQRQRNLERKRESERQAAIQAAQEVQRRRLEKEAREQRRIIAREQERRWNQKYTGCDSESYSKKLELAGLKKQGSVEGICISTEPSLSGDPRGTMTNCPPCG